jgi:hypothetical protein
MPVEVQLLLTASIAIAFVHTLAGPDHYLPFIALARSRGWSARKMVMWTIICGCGHVWSSVFLALAGAAIGWSVHSLKWLESIRGGWAGWFLLVFGLLYAVWGLIKAYRGSTHKHFEWNDDNSFYVYQHRHGEAVAPHEKHAVTPWVLFLIFVLGPCEPMIPLLYLPATRSAWWVMGVLITVYTFFTLVTMLVMVLLGYYGVSLIKSNVLHRYIHTISGSAILVCGVGMVFMNW